MLLETCWTGVVMSVAASETRQTLSPLQLSTKYKLNKNLLPHTVLPTKRVNPSILPSFVGCDMLYL